MVRIIDNEPVIDEIDRKYNMQTGRLTEPLSEQAYQYQQKKNTEEVFRPGFFPDLDEQALRRGVINDETIILAKVKLEECYYRIISVLRKYLDMKEDYYKFISAWIISTYFHNEFNTFPYLFFNAMRGSGKTRTLKLISSLAAKGDGSVQNNLTEAVLFRIPKGTTTCIDEVEQIGSKEKQTLRELLNSAYKKGMKVKRMKKVRVDGQEQQIAETFEPYFPIVMANIWGMDEVLSDRSITLILEKSNNPAQTKLIEDFDTNQEILDIKRTLDIISVVNVVKLRKKTYNTMWNNYIFEKYNNTTTYTTITTITTLTTLKDKKEEKELEVITPGRMHKKLEEYEILEFFNKLDDSGITGRNFELLFPVLITAKEVSTECFEDILSIGRRIVEIKKEDEYVDSKDVSLFEFVYSLRSRGLEHQSIKKLTAEFRSYIGEQDQDDRWLNEKWMGRALKRLALVVNHKRLSTGIVVILDYVKAQKQLRIFKDVDNE